MPSSSIAFARARMPMPLAFSVRKSSSMMMIGKRNLTVRSSLGSQSAVVASNVRRTTARRKWVASNLGQGDTDLALVLAVPVPVRRLAHVVGCGFEEDHLRDAFVRINLRG